MTRLKIRMPDDFHRHLRRYELLPTLLRHLGPFARAVVMPNVKNDILDSRDIEGYRFEITSSLPAGVDFKPLMTVKITTETKPDTILQAAKVGAVAAKYYPPQLTTNSGNGIPADDFAERGDLFEALQQANMLLLLHGEHDKSARCIDREEDFLKVVLQIAQRFSKLRVVLEHVTTAKAITAVTYEFPNNVAATITPHHLKLTLNDIIGDNLHPHNFCKPVAKWEEDRLALIEAATSGNPKFFAGTDCAAHLKGNKECAEGCAGVFTGEWGALHYADIFDQAGKLDRLEGFLCKFGADFYGLPTNSGEVELVKQATIIPKETDGIVPFQAGLSLPWSYES